MKFEKLNENKIRIILNTQDLVDKNIDFNSFMSNSIETQGLFLDMLEEAEEKVGFVTRDYKIKIEALAMDSGDFVIIVTRFNNCDDSKISAPTRAKKVTAKRKSNPPNSDCLIYSFNSFDDVCNFSNYITQFSGFNNIAKSVTLYDYNSKYYLSFTKINTDSPNLKNFYALITEFGTYINSPDLFFHKLTEHGKIIIKNNAIKTCSNYFSH